MVARSFQDATGNGCQVPAIGVWFCPDLAKYHAQGTPQGLCRATHTLAEQIPNQLDETIGIERLKPENYIEPLICGFGIGKAA
jgi:hypothetical protein